MKYGFEYIRIRSQYTPYSIYLRGTISLGSEQPADLSAGLLMPFQAVPFYEPFCLPVGTLNPRPLNPSLLEPKLSTLCLPLIVFLEGLSLEVALILPTHENGPQRLFSNLWVFLVYAIVRHKVSSGRAMDALQTFTTLLDARNILH